MIWSYFIVFALLVRSPVDDRSMGCMAQPETAGIRSNRIGSCCLFCLHPHNVDNAGAAAAPHNGRDTPVVQFLSSSGGHNRLQPLAIQVDIGLLDPPGGSLRLHQSLQTRNPFQNADAGITKPMVCTSCDCLHDGIRTAGRCSHHVGVPAFLQKGGRYRQRDGNNRQSRLRRTVVYDSRYAYGCHLGKRSLGTLLGMGSERDMGRHHLAVISCLYSLSAVPPPLHPPFSVAHHHRFLPVADVLVGNQLPAVGTGDERAYLQPDLN